MKRIILAPLLSAFVLPGLGQIVNRQFRKAGLLMAAVFLLLLALFFKLLYDLNKILLSLPVENFEKNTPAFSTIAQALSQQDKTVLFFLMLVLMVIWVYGVWDAFSVARKADRGQP
jgi:hypothetical protein